MKKEFLKKLDLPDKPGVYFFLHDKKILYIGKATSLRERTKSYFSPDLIKTRGMVTLNMVVKADNLKWQETETVLEALILEANLIKKYKPYHNIREKDDKSFNYVVITKEELPKVIVVRGRNLEVTNYAESKPSSGPRSAGSHPGQTIRKASFGSVDKVYGPFTSGSQLREALKIVRRIFPFLDDKSKNYLDFYRQINLAPDPEDRELYLKNIKNIKLLFSGKKKEILRNLKKQMKEYAKAREFEKAGEVKRQIFALEHINDVALLKYNGFTDEKNFSFRVEAYDIAHMSGKNIVGVMTVVENNEAVKSQYRMFKIRTLSGADDTGALKEIMERRFNHPEWTFPGLIVVDGGVAQLNAAKSVVEKIGLQTPIVSVLKDERHKPKDILGDEVLARKYKSSILLANSEAHRFGINFHKKVRAKNFLGRK